MLRMGMWKGQGKCSGLLQLILASSEILSFAGAGQQQARNCISDHLNYSELPENPKTVQCIDNFLFGDTVGVINHSESVSKKASMVIMSPSKAALHVI